MRIAHACMIIVVVVGLSCRARATSFTHKPWGMGKDFYLEFPPAGWGTQQVGGILVSPLRQRVTFTVAGKQYQNLINAPNTAMYLGGMVHILHGTDVTDVHGALRINTPEPASVVGQFGVIATKGTYTAEAANTWGTEYYVIGTPEGANEGTVYYPTEFSTPGIMIFARLGGTVATITPSANAAGGHTAGVPYSVLLGAGDVYFISTPADPNWSLTAPEFQLCEADFSGTHIVSNNPIAVLSSNSFGSWPCGDAACGDYGIEWMPPVCQWDTEYVVTQSVVRATDAPGDLLRFVFAEPQTELYVDEGYGPQRQGMFGAGDVFDYVRPFKGLRITANHPFLPMNITLKTAGCAPNVRGVEPWNFSMAVQVGVRQWCTDASFAVGWNATNFVDLLFRTTDLGNITVNDEPVSTLAPTANPLPGGYSYIRFEPGSNAAPIHIHGANGATFGGTVFGHGTSGTAPGGDPTDRVQTAPVAINSFAHPMFPPSASLCSPDVTAPRFQIVSATCGQWNIDVRDDELLPSGTGIADITLARIDSADTTYNVVFHALPSFTYGDPSVSCSLDVVNLAAPAQASIHVRDMAGNELDTVLTYAPIGVTATPSVVQLGSIQPGDSAIARVVLTNPGSSPAEFSDVRLRYGATRHWTLVPPTLPLILAPGGRDTLVCTYTAPVTTEQECDEDSILITTCRPFAIAVLNACNRRPRMSASNADFACAMIDTIERPGGDVTDSITVSNTGVDSLRISAVTLIGIDPQDVRNDPTRDFTILTPLPSVAQPWLVAPAASMIVRVQSHPHHTGPRTAGLVFTSDGHVMQDTALLRGCGLPQDLAAVSQASASLPGALSLAAYPNPIASTSTIAFTLPQHEHVTITVFNTLGEPQRIVLDADLAPGSHRLSIDASALRSGIYFCKVHAGTRSELRTLIVK